MPGCPVTAHVAERVWSHRTRSILGTGRCVIEWTVECSEVRQSADGDPWKGLEEDGDSRRRPMEPVCQGNRRDNEALLVHLGDVGAVGPTGGRVAAEGARQR